jgi:hypothetical protein
MSEHPIFKSKVEHLESKTYTDSPIEFTTSATLLKKDLERIRSNADGEVMTWGQMIDNRAAVEEYLRSQINFNHKLMKKKDNKDKNGDEPVNFILSDAKVHGIQSPDPHGGLVMAGTAAFPYIEGMDYPSHQHNGKWRKVFDLNRPRFLALGKPHSFGAIPKPQHSKDEHILFHIDSQTMPQVMYPDGEIHGASPFAVTFKERDDGSLQVVPRGPGMMHGHMINNESVYGCVTARPQVSTHLRPTAGDGVVTEEHVLIPPGIYQESWFSRSPQYHTDKGPMVPLKEYAEGTYDFLDQLNSTRVTNLDSSGIWWNAQYLKDIPCIKMFLTFRIIPIVDYHKEGAKTVPYQNLLKHVKGVIEEVD